MLSKHKSNGLELPEMVYGVAMLSFVAAEATGCSSISTTFSTVLILPQRRRKKKKEEEEEEMVIL